MARSAWTCPHCRTPIVVPNPGALNAAARFHLKETHRVTPSPGWYAVRGN